MSKSTIPLPSMTAPAPAAARQALVKLAPRTLIRNPVIFATAVVALMVTLMGLRDLALGVPGAGVAVQVATWLWAAVLIANFAESLAKRRGRARADSLRATKSETMVRVLTQADSLHDGATRVSSSSLRKGQIVLVAAGDIIPADAEVVQGVASVDESAITGESAPVIRESGGDFCSVTGGTRIVSDWLVLRVTAEPGRSFLDRMIALVEGAERGKTPNEIALNILLAGLTLIFLFVVVTLEPFAVYSGTSIPVVFLAALFVTLIPTTIGGLLSAIGIAGMNRLARANVVAKSGRAVEAAGDVDVLLLDKTGTITFGNRMADALIPAQGVSPAALARAAFGASRADDTPEGKSIVEIARKEPGAADGLPAIAEAIPFSAQTRLSGADLQDGTRLRKGSVDAILRHTGAVMDAGLASSVDHIARSGGTPLLVSQDARILGAVHLKDIIKPGVRERFAELRAMGIRTVMITGDNPLTAAAIAAEAGVDDFLAEATPEAKLELIRAEQAKGQMVAMCGDGTNDAPALAQADVGVAMNSGTSAAKEAANLIDLDSDPTKLIEVVLVGKQLLISRGALTTFSIANDVAKYFAILPALFIAAYPGLSVLNVMGLGSAQSAILSAVIFNALVILALIPLALRGVKYSPASAAALLRRNLTIYGLGGLIVPFVGIKAIDMAVIALWHGLKELTMNEHIRPAVATLGLMIAMTGIAYPLAMTGLGQALLPEQANASLITRDGQIVGSVLVGQPFSAPQYLHPRPSAVGYDAASAGASNLAPTSAALLAEQAARAEAFRADTGTARVPDEAAGPLFEAMTASLRASSAQVGMVDIMRLASVAVFRVDAITVILHPEGLEVQVQPVPPPRPSLERAVDAIARIAAETETAGIVDAALDGACRLLDAPAVIPLQFDTERQMLVTLASHGYLRTGAGSKIVIGHGIAGALAALGRPVRVSDMRRLRRFGAAIRDASSSEESCAIPLTGMSEALSQLCHADPCQGNALR